jgi:hypothetical protein
MPVQPRPAVPAGEPLKSAATRGREALSGACDHVRSNRRRQEHDRGRQQHADAHTADDGHNYQQDHEQTDPPLVVPLVVPVGIHLERQRVHPGLHAESNDRLTESL